MTRFRIFLLLIFLLLSGKYSFAQRGLIISKDTSICRGGNVQLNTSGATNYSWSPAAGLSCTTCSNPVATPLVSTTYYLTTVNNGHASTDSVIIVVITPPKIILLTPDTTICKGSSIKLSVNPLPNYLWSPSVGLSCITCASPVANPTLTSIYHLTTDSLGCISSDSVIIKVDVAPFITAGPDVTICSGKSTKLSSSGNGIYVWSPSNGLNNPDVSSPTASPTITTAYVVTNTNACGNATDTTLVTVKPSPNIKNLTPGKNICVGDSVLLSVDSLSNYSWIPSNGLSCTTCPNPVASPTTSTTYQLVSFIGTCTSTDSVVISVSPVPVINAGQDTGFCKGKTVQLSATGNGNYLWSPAKGLSNTAISNPVANPVVTTTYTVTNTICGIATDSIVVTVIPYPVISFISPDVTICKGTSTILLVNEYANYSWSPRTGLDCYVCELTHAQPDSTTTYFVILNNNGCKSTDSVTVTVYDAPSFSASGDAIICEGHSTILSATKTDSYIWLPQTGLNNNTIENPTATPIVTTTYTVQGTDSLCGPKTANVVVTIQNKPVITVSSDTSVCAGGSVQLQAFGGITYKWSPQSGLNDNSSSNPVANPSSTTTYTVSGYNLPDCFSNAEVTVYIIPYPDIQLDSVTQIVCGQSIQLTASVINATEYHWEVAAGLTDSLSLTPVVNPKVNTIYTFVASDKGCETSAKVEVNILEGYINLPTAFSPNNDGHDDIFRLIYSCEFTLEYFRIFNRWGEMVFETQQPETGWDGKYKGNNAPIGVYMYVIVGHRDNGEKISMKGNVTLLR